VRDGERYTEEREWAEWGDHELILGPSWVGGAGNKGHGRWAKAK